MKHYKTGSIYEDMVKPLEDQLFWFITSEEKRWRERLNSQVIHYDLESRMIIPIAGWWLENLKLLRCYVNKIAHEVVNIMLKHDYVFSENPFFFCEDPEIELRIRVEPCHTIYFKLRDLFLSRREYDAS